MKRKFNKQMEFKFYDSLSKKELIERCMWYNKNINRLVKELDNIKK